MRDRQGYRGDIAVLCAQLAAGATLRDAVAAADMSDRTARRRLKDPDVQAMLQRLTDERSSAVTAELVTLGRKAVATLAAVMDDPLAGENAKLRAAQAVLTLTIRYQEHSVERRLVALEEEHLEQQRVRARLEQFFGDES